MQHMSNENSEKQPEAEIIENGDTEHSQEQSAAPDSPEAAIEALTKELKDQQSKYLYLYAEFETYKKRAIKERSDLIKFGYESISKELLSSVDNFERALEHAEKTTDVKNLVLGIKMVHQQIKDTLSKFGIVPIETVGQKFDPEKHEAVAQDPSTDKQPGTITQEAQKGYTLHGRLLRPARVVVASSAS